MASLKVTDGNLSSLEKDGISDELFQLLWSKDELNYGPSINIPDTILYKFGQPTAWYFTSVNGRVKKKNKHNLISAKIEEVFNKHVLGYDVLAMFISMPGEDQTTASDHQTTIEYLDRDALNKFLYSRKKEINGILQRFIEPKSVRNEVVRAIWSPKVCLLERAENIHQLHDHRYGLYERCVIYEGPEYYFTSAPLRGPVLSGQLQKLCESVVAHISEVTFGQKQVSRIVLNFKVDSRDKVWLLYSTSIRCIDMLEYTSPANAAMANQRHLVNIDSVVSLSNTVHLNPQKSYEKIVPKKRIRCLSCARETLEDMRHPITYKGVIKHYEHVLHLLTDAAGADGSGSPGSTLRKRNTGANGGAESLAGTSSGEPMINWPPDAQIVEAAGGVGFGCLYITDTGELLTHTQIEHHSKPRKVKDLQIPPIIHNIHYKLSLKSYHKCKHDPLFLYKTVHVCEACYLVYAEFTTMLLQLGQDLTKLLTPDPVASQGLMSATAGASLERPSSADWRELGSNAKQASLGARSASLSALGPPNGKMTRPAGTLHRSANHKHALKSAIGIRSSETIRQPSVPDSVAMHQQHGGGGRSPHGPRGASDYSIAGGHSLSQPSGEMQLGGTLFADSQTLEHHPTKGASGSKRSSAAQQQHQYGSGVGAGSSTSAGGGSSLYAYDADEVKQTIADRERHFFKEVSLNPNLKDQHPLMHLISAQEKMKLVDEQSGVLMSKTASKEESVFGTRYGKQAGDRYKRHAAYRVENPYTINGEVILPTKLRARVKEETQRKKERKQRSLQALLNPDSVKGEEDSSLGGAGSISTRAGKSSAASGKGSLASIDASVKASVRHREYLAESLKRLDQDVDDADDFRGKYTGDFDDNASKQSRQSSRQSRQRNGGGGDGSLDGSTIASRKSTGTAQSSKSGGAGMGMAGQKSPSRVSSRAPSPAPSPLPSAPNSPTRPAAAGAGSPARQQQQQQQKPFAEWEGDDGAEADDEADNGSVRHSLANSLEPSLGEGSTESALMRHWGLEEQAAAGANVSPAEERQLVSGEANALFTALERGSDKKGIASVQVIDSEQAMVAAVLGAMDGAGTDDAETETETEIAGGGGSRLGVGGGVVGGGGDGGDSAASESDTDRSTRSETRKGRRGNVLQPLEEDATPRDEPSPLPSARNNRTPRTPQPRIPSKSFSSGTSLDDGQSRGSSKSSRRPPGSPARSIESLQSLDENSVITGDPTAVAGSDPTAVAGSDPTAVAGSDAAKPGEEQLPSQDQPSQDQPTSQDQPSQDQPSQDQPSQDQPSQDQPSQDQPSQDQPSQDQPSQDQPSQDQPSQDQPSQDQPSSQQLN